MMIDFLVVESVGFISILLGVFLIRRERKLMDNSEVVLATVVDYDHCYHNHVTYSMVVTYVINGHQQIRAGEQKSSNKKKYKIGDQIEVRYSLLKPEFYVVCGDHTRMIAFTGMIIVGLAMMLGLGYVLFNR